MNADPKLQSALPMLAALPSGPTRTLATLVLGCALAGCAVPPQMRIEHAHDPRLEDRDVRFRATYYFRVVNMCSSDQSRADAARPAVDSLYRFRMTGKAHSLTTQVHFESGTLTASQIDPFGAAVAYDERARQHYFRSQADVQRDGQRERRLDDLARLLDQYASPALAAAAPGQAASGGDEGRIRQAYADLIRQRIESLADPVAATSAATATAATVIASASASAPAPAASAGSSTCNQYKRGFQVLGPEGWRTMNPDERLLLAMSTSGRPLISTMQELSGRVLNNQPVQAELLLPLVREDLRISRAQRALDRLAAAPPDRAAALLKAVIEPLADSEAAK